VFRTDIAQATGLGQSVTVNNTAANPVPVNVTNTAVPVREQNLDGGNIKVHEQGTANVAVKSYPAASTFVRFSYLGVPATETRTENFDRLNASTVIFNIYTGSADFELLDTTQPGTGNFYPIIVTLIAPATVTIPLNETLAVDQSRVHCQPGGGDCSFNYSIIGH
jgi:hypothetical protein